MEPEAQAAAWPLFWLWAGRTCPLIARGDHLKAIQDHGLVLETGHGTFAVPVRAMEQEQVVQRPDVIFVCVKGYSLEGTLPTLKRLRDEHTIIIPLLNLYGTGGRLQPELSPLWSPTDASISPLK